MELVHKQWIQCSKLNFRYWIEVWPHSIAMQIGLLSAKTCFACCKSVEIKWPHFYRTAVSRPFPTIHPSCECVCVCWPLSRSLFPYDNTQSPTYSFKISLALSLSLANGLSIVIFRFDQLWFAVLVKSTLLLPLCCWGLCCCECRERERAHRRMFFVSIYAVV